MGLSTSLINQGQQGYIAGYVAEGEKGKERKREIYVAFASNATADPSSPVVP